MTRRLTIALAAFAALAAASAPASAERLVATLSRHQVLVNSNFTGSLIVLFGTIEPDTPASRRRTTGYDLVVTVTGPKQTLVARKKERVLGIWTNMDSRTFVNVPSYLAVLSTQPFEQFTTADTIKQQQLGLVPAEGHQTHPVAALVGVEQEREDRRLDLAHPLAGGHRPGGVDGEQHEVGLAPAGDRVAQVVAGDPGRAGARSAPRGRGPEGGGQVHRRPGGLVARWVGADDPATRGEGGRAATGRAGADPGQLEAPVAVGLGGRGGAGGGRLGTRRGRRG